MRLVPKLSLFFVTTVTVVLGARTALQVERDTELFESDMRRDHMVLLRELRAGVIEQMAQSDADGAAHLVEAAAAADRDVSISWRRNDAHSGDGTRVEGGQLVTELRVTPDAGVLEVRESLAGRDRFVHGNVVSAVTSVLALAFVTALVALLSNRLLVGRPMAALVDKARRTGRGDLTGPLARGGNDELGELALEMNEMCDRLAETRSRLASETAARLDALEQVRHADRLATVGKIAAGLAHEIGTPLSVVSGHAQMIAEREVDGDKVIASAEVIDAQVTRISRLVRQLLDYARRSPGAGSTSVASKVARSSLSLVLPMAEKSGVKMTVSVAEAAEETAVQIDPERLSQVFTNLLLNAVAATPRGGDVTLEIEGANDGAVIRVRDTGNGMSDDVASRIFEPFFTTKPAGEGTGLGLAVVHGIVTDHGGSIDVRSRIGEGSTFTLSFPKETSG